MVSIKKERKKERKKLLNTFTDLISEIYHQYASLTSKSHFSVFLEISNLIFC